VAEKTFLPEWAEDRPTLIRVSCGLGVLLAASFAGASFTAYETVGFWVSSFFSTFIPAGLVALLVLLAVVRRLTMGPARKQTLRTIPWLVGYVLAALPTVIAAVSLLALAIISWAFDWQSRTAFAQALIVLTLCFFLLSTSVKIALNAQLLITHWRGS
jgi:cytochrome bd-type quinol oxidase subunit 2